MTDSQTAPDTFAEPGEVRHANVAASTVSAGDTIRHLGMWFEVRSVMTLNGDVCIALVTASSEARLVWQVPADTQVMTWKTP